MDLLTNTFAADWNYWDEESDSLVSIPRVEVKMYNPPIYTDDFLWIDEKQAEKLYALYKNKCLYQRFVCKFSNVELPYIAGTHEEAGKESVFFGKELSPQDSILSPLLELCTYKNEKMVSRLIIAGG